MRTRQRFPNTEFAQESKGVVAAHGVCSWAPWLAVRPPEQTAVHTLSRFTLAGCPQ